MVSSNFYNSQDQEKIKGNNLFVFEEMPLLNQGLLHVKKGKSSLNTRPNSFQNSRNKMSTLILISNVVPTQVTNSSQNNS